MKLRDRFDENKYERDQKKVHSILEAAEAEFEKMKHPFPYTRKCLKLCFSAIRLKSNVRGCNECDSTNSDIARVLSLII